MISLVNKSIAEKVSLITEATNKYTNSNFIRRILDKEKPETWKDALDYVQKNLRYKHEVKDVLYEPPEALRKVDVDCEDFTVFLGSMFKTMGYNVRLKVISNATFHIYPEIQLPRTKPIQWVGVDATTGKVGQVIYPMEYKPYMIKPLGEIARKYEEISLEESVQPGDILRLHYKSKWYIPDIIEEPITKWIVSYTHPEFKVLDVIREEDTFIIEVEVTGQHQAIGAIFIPVAIIAGAIAVSTIGAWLSLTKVEKVIEKGGLAPLTIGAIALLIFALVALGKR